MIVETLLNSPEVEGKVSIIPLHVRKPPVEDWIRNHVGDSTIHVFFRDGENRFINNLNMVVLGTDRQESTLIAKLTEMPQTQCSRALSADDVKVDNNIIEIAGCVFIVCCKIDSDNRSSFYIALTRDVDVHGHGHRAKPAFNFIN